jgi:hypothetical protein
MTRSSRLATAYPALTTTGDNRALTERCALTLRIVPNGLRFVT